MSYSKTTKFVECCIAAQEPLGEYLLAMGNDPNDVSDLKSEVFLIVWEKFEKINDHEKLLPFMIGIARNLLKKERRRRYMSPMSMPVETMPDQSDASQDPVAWTDLSILLEEVDRLPEFQKDALLMFELHGMPIKEISKVQQSSLSAVKARIFRARRQVKTVLHSS